MTKPISEGTRKRKKEQLVTVHLTSKELNYLDSALRAQIDKYEKIEEPLSCEKHFLWFDKRLRGKLKRLHNAAYDRWLGPKKRKMIRDFIRKQIRKHNPRKP